MKNFFVCCLAILGLIMIPAAAYSQSSPQKFALVIGNGSYTDLGRLANPVNDANDITTVLQDLGFTVDKVLDGNLEQMENAVMRLKNRLSASPNSYGFFFYAGHGVQSNGENFLIPADANIPSESFLRNRSVSVQIILDELNSAQNSLNVVVLDACRDNPFGWSRSGSRGLVIVNRQPADSIIVYATGAGQRASDGTGRNGLFTSQLLNNLRDQSLEVKEVFNRTGADVSAVSNRQQVPAIYNQFFGTAYLGTRLVVQPPVFQTGAISTATGMLEVLTVTAGTVEITGAAINQKIELPAWGHLPIESINAGNYRIVMVYEDGKIEEQTVELGRSETQRVEFNYKPVPIPVTPVRPVRPPKQPKEKTPLDSEESYLWTVGASVGSSFSAPWFIGTLQLTIAPWKNSFFELGLDFGFISGYSKVDHNSFCPFIHYALFAPITNTSGWYIGAGAGYMITNYTFPEGRISENIFAADAVTGFIIGNRFTISWTLRTDFATVSNKFAVGFAYRGISR